MNLKEIMLEKAHHPVRLIAKNRKSFILGDNPEYILYEIGDEVGIEAIDFSAGYLRVCNKTNPMIFQIIYDKETWELCGEWEFK
jgi:hypothetical protein